MWRAPVKFCDSDCVRMWSHVQLFNKGVTLTVIVIQTLCNFITGQFPGKLRFGYISIKDRCRAFKGCLGANVMPSCASVCVCVCVCV